MDPPSLRLFFVTGRGSGGDCASDGGLVVDVLIDCWRLECSKSITRRRVICFYFLYFLNFLVNFLFGFLIAF